MENCTRCQKPLTEEEVEDPYEDDGDIICTECEIELHFDTCSICEESVRDEELVSEIGQLIVLFEECGEDFPAGYYRIRERPFYCQSMVGAGWFFPGAIERVADLDKEATRAAKGAWCPSGAMCNACREHVEAAIEERAAMLA